MGIFGQGEFQIRTFRMIGRAADSSLRFYQLQTNQLRKQINLPQYVIRVSTHSNYNHSAFY